MSIDRNSAFVSKYAPKKLEDVVFAEFAVEQEIQRYVAREDMRPLILYGPNGTGKSTVAKLVPNEFISGTDVHELDPLLVAIEPRVKKRFLDNLQIRSLMGTKTYILDEFDLMPKPFVRTIKLAIDQASETVRFIATTNNLNVLDKGHRSRAVCLRLVQAPLERWKPRVEAILGAEGVPILEDQLLKEMLQNSGGDNRKFLADLQLYVEGVQAMKLETA